jgi:hypothetical protein
MTNRPAATNCETAQSNSARPDLKLVPDSISDASPDMAVQLSRIEGHLDSMLRTLAPLAGGVR